VSVTTLARPPDHFVLDGDIAEWGPLRPAPRPAAPAPTAGKPAPPRDPNPVNAPSRVAVVLSSEGALIAADLAEASRDGIWLGITFPAPEAPPIGYFQRGGGVQELDCEVDTLTGEPLAPETAKACQALLDRHEAFVDSHQARFTRFYRIDKAGIRAAVGPGEPPAPIDGARAAFKETGDRVTIEVALPAKALPRVAEAPVESMSLVALAAAESEPHTVSPESWVPIGVPAAVGFEPYAALRARSFVESRGAWAPLGMSYQPGDALGLEVIRYSPGANGTAIESARETLYRQEETLGDLEIGYVFTNGRSVGITRKGAIVELVSLSGEPVGIVKRGKDLHVFSYSQQSHPDTLAEGATWQVVIIRPDGTTRAGIGDATGMNRIWQIVSEFHAPTFDTFGLRGTPAYAEDEKPPPDVEVTWRYNPRSEVYEARERKLGARR
jgi:hypothetical protein